MANVKTQFWISVDEAEAEIRAELPKIDRQPRDGTAYITSLKVRGGDPLSKAGVVSLATIRLAAQRVVENSQRLSTASEIEQYESEMAQRRKEMIGGATGKNTLVFAQPKEIK